MAHPALPDPARPAAPPAGRPPRWSGPAAHATITVQRRVSSRGGIMVAKQKIQAGMTHAGKIATVVCEKNSFRLVIDGDTIAEVPRTTSQEISRYKAYATRPGRR